MTTSKTIGQESAQVDVIALSRLFEQLVYENEHLRAKLWALLYPAPELYEDGSGI